MPSLSERIEQLLNEARQIGSDWWSRGDLAKRKGKKQLNPQEQTILASMVEMGILEAREVPTNAPSGVRWEYKIKQEDGR